MLIRSLETSNRFEAVSITITHGYYYVTNRSEQVLFMKPFIRSKTEMLILQCSFQGISQKGYTQGKLVICHLVSLATSQ